LEVEASKKLTSLRREAYVEVKMQQTATFGPLLEVHVAFFATGLMDFVLLQN